jgi:hypothetical protein
MTQAAGRQLSRTILCKAEDHVDGYVSHSGLDIKLIGWANKEDGSPSDRLAENDGGGPEGLQSRLTGT